MRKKIFIIHGKAISFQEALALISGIFNLKIFYYKDPARKKADYYLPSAARTVNYVLGEEHKNTFLKALKDIITVKLVLSKYETDENFTPEGKKNLKRLSSFKSESALKSGNFGANEEDQRKNASKTYLDSLRIFSDGLNCGISEEEIKNYINSLHSYLGNSEQGKYIEKHAADLIVQTVSAGQGEGKEFLKALIEIKRANESGGDLDTIASNTLYGIWALHKIYEDTEQEAVYGRDFEFDFVNYHEGLGHLAKNENCDIYIPDFPIDAVPDITSDAEKINEAGSFIVSYDDHHPYSKESMVKLSTLKLKNKIGAYNIHAALKGKELKKENLKCGTDLIYEKWIKETSIDNPVIQHLVQIAHIQDLGLGRDDTALELSKLIGSKHSKLDMAQGLIIGIGAEKKDLKTIIKKNGWRTKVQSYEEDISALSAKLEESAAIVEYKPKAEEPYLSEYFNHKIPKFKKSIINLIEKITFGAVNLTSKLFSADTKNVSRILLVLSPQQSQKEQKLNVASAINHFKGKFDFDYFFYCYGLSLMTMRNVNKNDSSLDLSFFGEALGEGGGHKEAASCKPIKSPRFPGHKFQKLDAQNFEEYAHLIGQLMSRIFGYKLLKSYKPELKGNKK